MQSDGNMPAGGNGGAGNMPSGDGEESEEENTPNGGDNSSM